MVSRFLLLATFGAAMLACSGDDERPDAAAPEVPEAAAAPAPDLRLVVLTDLAGYLEPCGCTTRPLGGIDRMAASARALGREAPTLFLTAGDLLFGGDAHGVEGAETQERWQAETLLSVLGELDFAAATPGPKDLSHGSEVFESLQQASEIQWLAAGLTSGGEGRAAAFAPSMIRDVAGLKVGVLGVTDVLGGDLPAPYERRLPAIQAAREAAAALRAEGADVVVALVRANRREARAVGRLPGIDFVVQAGLDREEALPPSATADSWVVHGGRQGQHLLVVDLFRRGDGPYADASSWTRDVESARLRQDADDLRAQIERWAASAETNQAELASQRQRLTRIEAELAQTEAAPTVPPTGNAFVASLLELSPDIEGEESVRARVAAFSRRVNEHNREALAHIVAPPVPEGGAGYVGTATCSTCHPGARAWWDGHAHSDAYETLESQHKNYNLSCVGCHVTGYQMPGGATVSHHDQLRDVGCESCHGPGSLHVASAPDHIRRQVPAGVCVRCHNSDHSDSFDYEAYLRSVVVPGHGAPE